MPLVSSAGMAAVTGHIAEDSAPSPDELATSGNHLYLPKIGGGDNFLGCREEG